MTLADDYGYYKLGNIKTYSKYDVMVKTNDPYTVTWHYNDDFFSQFDWTKEPDESIETLYRKKAEQLRKDYDYIILMYSSGSDSDNILETFVRNDIKLDEVCSLVNLEGSGSKESFANREVYQIACPKIINLNKKYGLNIKHRIFDITQKIINYYSNKKPLDFKWINTYGSVNCLSKYKLYDDIPEWKNIAKDGKKVCIIWGCDKPRLSVIEDRVYFYFSDVIDGAMCLKEQKEGFNESFHNDLFYWSPTIESAKIIIKQSHLIKNYILNEDNRKYHKRDKNYNEIYIHMKKPIGCLGDNDFKNIIYPWWEKTNDIHTKTKNGNFLSDRDDWFWQKYNDQSTENYLSDLTEFYKNIHTVWAESYVDFEYELYPKFIKRMNSKTYPLQ
jgi:hypothetical protein